MLAAGMLAVSACTLNAQPNFTLTLPVPAENNNTMAYLINWDESQKIDSVLVTDGVVKFSGNVDTPFLGTVSVNGGRGPIVIIEPGNIVVSESKLASGTPLNDKFESYIRRRNQIAQEFRTLDQNDSTQMEKAKALEQEYTGISKKAYSENVGTPVGLFWFLQDAYEMNLDQIDAAMAKDPALKASKRLESLRNSLLAKSETSEGKHYKDFTVSYNGKEEKLSDYVKPGRFTLVDFWASWCGPCIRETKVLKKIREEFEGKNLDILGVAVWDEPDATVKAIERHQLPWPQIINAQSVPTDLYGISGIPCIILFGPDGTIISRDLQGDALVESVRNALNPAPAQTPAPAATPAQ